MKRILSSLFIALLGGVAYSQCNEIMISEIVEGWSNNKAIEIYNASPNAIDLTGYGIVRFQNGSTTYGNISYLDGYTVASHDVLVVVLDKRDSLGTGLEAPVWDELQDAGDAFINPTYDNGVWAMYFNGNDAIAIVKNGGQTLVDLFGRIGEGSGFGGWSAYATDSLGDPVYASEDHTMIRKASVQSGVSQNPSSFDVFAQYDTLPANTFDQLGFHNCACGNTGVQSVEVSQLGVYPNPASGNVVNIIAPSMMNTITIHDAMGRVVKSMVNVQDRMIALPISDLSVGAFIVDVQLVNGNRLRQQFVK
jgi:Lamin Tail Domain/Secretion system C-terminal sorting domain